MCARVCVYPRVGWQELLTLTYIYIYIYICIGVADAHGMAAGARLLLLLDDPPGIVHGVHVRSRLQRGQQICKYVCMA